ncbi:MAG: CHAD domain-containing protein, partial [Gammaproteobacteria bacterium]|nr:CHAD domain-containing protein [Gammaproteobacteria bacterium]
MNCLDKYRGKLIRQLNRDLQVIRITAEEEAVHDFRVGMKRLTALYYFLNDVDPALKTRKLIKPYRSLAKSIGVIRDGHIVVHLIQELDEISLVDKKNLISALRVKTRNDYRLLKRSLQADTHTRVRVPTIRSMAISERAILREKPMILNVLLSQIMSTRPRMTADLWHKKRILLKRYHHKLDAFQFCPGHTSDESELKQIKILEQLLGDWHDRVIAAEILQVLNGVETEADHA